MISRRYSLHKFTHLVGAGFAARDYSYLKHGSNRIAKMFGQSLAEGFFHECADLLIANRVVVIPSPYNHVKNAATLLTQHFVDHLNELLINASGAHVECSTIHRKVSYTSDYGFLSKEKRKALIDNDSFYLNRQFLTDKLLIFVDDVRITGTHEDKLVDILNEQQVLNDRLFVYFAEYKGWDNPSIESEFNNAGIRSVPEYIQLCRKEKDHAVLVRPIKLVLGESLTPLDASLIPTKTLSQIYYGALGEGYYKIPKYQANFAAIALELKRR